MWVFSTTGCRDFRDHRTPYKSYVKIKFKFVSQEKLLITVARVPVPEIGDGSTLYQPDGDKPVEFEAPFDPHTDSMKLYIHHASDPTKTLTIHYRKEVALVSHQCGCAHKYVLNSVASNFGAKYRIINKELSIHNESAIDLEIYL